MEPEVIASPGTEVMTVRDVSMKGCMKVVYDRGSTLIETMIAVFVALVAVFGLGAVIFQATAANKNQGTEKTRAVIYAQDKLEKLLSLDFNQCALATTFLPASCNTTNVTDSGWTTGLLAGGPISSTSVTGPPTARNCPAASGSAVGYMDFLDKNGQQLPGPSGGACSSVTGASIGYIREWSVTDLGLFSGGPAMKQITVAVYSQLAVTAPEGGSPIVVVASVVSNPN